MQNNKTKFFGENKIKVGRINAKQNKDISDIDKLKGDTSKLFFELNSDYELECYVNQSRTKVTLQLDSGSEYSLLSYETLQDIFPNFLNHLKIKTTDKTFQSITSNNLNILFTTKLKLKFFGTKFLSHNDEIIESKYRTETFFICSNKNVGLLGRSFINSQKIRNYTTDTGRYLISFDRPLLAKNIKIPCNKIVLNPGTSETINLTNDLIENKLYLCTPVKNKSLCFAPSSLVQGFNKSVNLLLINQNTKNVILEQGDIVFTLDPYVNNHHIKEENKIEFEKWNNNIFIYPLFCSKDNANFANYQHSDEIYDEKAVCKKCIKDLTVLDLCVIDIANYHEKHTSNDRNETGKLNNVDRSLFKNLNDSDELNDVNHSLYQNRNGSGELDNANNTIASIKLLNNFDLEGDSLPDVTVLSNSDLDDMIYEKIKHLPDIYRERLHKTLKTNNVSLTSTYSVPCAKTKIDLQFKSDIPRNTKIYSIPKDQKKIVYSTLQYLLFNGIIRRADPDKISEAPSFRCSERMGKLEFWLICVMSINHF